MTYPVHLMKTWKTSPFTWFQVGRKAGRRHEVKAIRTVPVKKPNSSHRKVLPIKGKQGTLTETRGRQTLYNWNDWMQRKHTRERLKAGWYILILLRWKTTTCTRNWKRERIIFEGKCDMSNFNWQEAMWSYPQVWIAQTGAETQKSRNGAKTGDSWIHWKTF